MNNQSKERTMQSWKRVVAITVGAAALMATTAGASIASASSTPQSATPSAASGLPAVYAQSLGQQSVPLEAINGGTNPFTPVTSSPVLPIGHYTYTTVVDIGSVAPGSIVLCGTESNKAVTDSGDYGIVDNTGGSAPESGHCVMSGAVKVTQASTTLSFWAVIYEGPAGAQVNGWSMTETQVGAITFTS